MMRIILGVNIKDKVSIDSMLDSTGFLSINQIVVKQVLMESWKILRYKINPLHDKMNPEKTSENNLRSYSNNLMKPSNIAENGFCKQAMKFWNNPLLEKEFRTCDKKATAKRIAKNFVKSHIPRTI